MRPNMVNQGSEENPDMDSAYDRTNWSFLLKIFQRLGFSDCWIQWVKACIYRPWVGGTTNQW